MVESTGCSEEFMSTIAIFHVGQPALLAIEFAQLQHAHGIIASKGVLGSGRIRVRSI